MAKRFLTDQPATTASTGTPDGPPKDCPTLAPIQPPDVVANTCSRAPARRWPDASPASYSEAPAAPESSRRHEPLEPASQAAAALPWMTPRPLSNTVQLPCPDNERRGESNRMAGANTTALELRKPSYSTTDAPRLRVPSVCATRGDPIERRKAPRARPTRQPRRVTEGFPYGFRLGGILPGAGLLVTSPDSVAKRIRTASAAAGEAPSTISRCTLRRNAM